MRAERPGLSSAVLEVLELWDEQLLAVWLEVYLASEWQSHVPSGISWPIPSPRPS